MPQGRARLIISGAPYRPAPPPAGQRLLSHRDFPPEPPPKVDTGDGFEALQAEIERTEQLLWAMRERLETLRARAKKRKPTMASVSRVKEPIKGRRL